MSSLLIRVFPAAALAGVCALATGLSAAEAPARLPRLVLEVDREAESYDYLTVEAGTGKILGSGVSSSNRKEMALQLSIPLGYDGPPLAVRCSSQRRKINPFVVIDPAKLLALRDEISRTRALIEKWNATEASKNLPAIEQRIEASRAALRALGWLHGIGPPQPRPSERDAAGFKFLLSQATLNLGVSKRKSGNTLDRAKWGDIRKQVKNVDQWLQEFTKPQAEWLFPLAQETKNIGSNHQDSVFELLIGGTVIDRKSFR